MGEMHSQSAEKSRSNEISFSRLSSITRLGTRYTMPRGTEPASTSAAAVTQMEVAALVYNYLRSNGFVKVS